MTKELTIIPDVERSAGEPLTVEALFLRYRSYVATIALRILGDGEAADDVVQETFLSALRRLDTLRDAEAARFWLATIAVRHARARLRRRRVLRWVGLDAVPDHAALAPGATPEQQALLSRLYAQLEALPTDERLAWTLRHMEGETLESVASLCGCSLATAKRRVAAAHTALQRALDGADHRGGPA